MTQHNFVISLTSALERRQHIRQEFGRHGVVFEFFDAITPANLAETAARLEIDISRSPLTPGELACALSHLALLQLAKERDLDYICIFEDDIYLGGNAAAFLSADYLNADVMVVKLEKNFERIVTQRQPSKTYFGRQFYRLTQVNSGAAGYLVTRRGIDYLLKRIRAIGDIEIDNLLFNFFLRDKNYVVWQIQPALCIQEAIFKPQQTHFVSTIGERERKRPKAPLLIRLYKELKRPFIRLRKKLFGRISTFQ